MQTIIATIITGLFSLTGIWYQNYLRSKSDRERGIADDRASRNVAGKEQKSSRYYSKQADKPTLRIIFTMLIVAIPWLSFNYLLRFVDRYTFIHSNAGQAVRHNLVIVRNEIALYCILWLIITVVALVIGWKRKTIFEKIILVVSAVWLIYIGVTRYTKYDRLISYEGPQMHDTFTNRQVSASRWG